MRTENKMDSKNKEDIRIEEASPVYGVPRIPDGEEVDMSRFELTFADEFDGDRVDNTVWTSENGVGATSVRHGSYWNTDMAVIKDGHLHIRIKYLPEGYHGNGKPGWYTAQLTTQTSFLQRGGYFECRCILPRGYGLWSAFWLFCKGVHRVGDEGRDGTEIDVFESPYYYKTDKWHNAVSSNLHYDGYGEAHRSVNVCTSLVTNDPYENFNTYGLEWSETEYTFYINGKKAGSSSFGGISEVPEWLLLSVEIGGENAVPGASDWSGPSIETDPSVVTDFIVDYVRAYQYKTGK